MLSAKIFQMAEQTNETQSPSHLRRLDLSKRITRLGSIALVPCCHCIATGSDCIISVESVRCAKCAQAGSRSCQATSCKSFCLFFALYGPDYFRRGTNG